MDKLEEKEVVLRQLTNTGAITQEKSWERVYNLIKSNNLEEATLNMQGIEVEAPWKFNWFFKIMKETNVRFKFINRHSLVSQLRLMCVTDGYDPDRIVCVEVEVKRPLRPEEKNMIALGKSFVSKMTFEDNIVVLNLNGVFEQISDYKTVNAIRIGFEEFDNIQKSKDANYTGAEQYIVVCDTMNIDDSVIEMVAKYVVDSYEKNKNVAFDCREDVAKRLQLHIFNVQNEHIKPDDKRKFWETVPVGMVGVLTKYKQTVRVDKLGRMGDGEIIASNICVYRGHKHGENGTSINIRIYKIEKFYTQNHWFLDHDGEMLSGLDYRDIGILAEDVGFVDKFLGKRYHFCEPTDNGERYRVIETLTNGSKETDMYTLAERIDKVLSSWGEEYNKELLKDFIRKEKENSNG